jgi:hypothetical protein
MKNPILFVRNAGFGETPVPADALLQPGAELNIINENDGTETAATVVAVVPAGVPAENAIADQNGQPRPLLLKQNHSAETTYVVDLAGRQIVINQSTMLAGLTAACPDCLGRGYPSDDPDIACPTCSGRGRRDLQETA